MWHIIVTLNGVIYSFRGNIKILVMDFIIKINLNKRSFKKQKAHEKKLQKSHPSLSSNVVSKMTCETAIWIPRWIFNADSRVHIMQFYHVWSLHCKYTKQIYLRDLMTDLYHLIDFITDSGLISGQNNPGIIRIPMSSRNFFCRGRPSYPSTPLGVQPWPLYVNVEIKSRSPQETEDFTGMLEKVEIKHKI